MRIAYISLHWTRPITSGVGQKIIRQVSAWRNAGHEVEVFMHSQQDRPESNLVPGKIFFFRKGNKLQTEWERIRAAMRLIKSIQSYKPDIIYLRYGIYVYPIQKLIEIAPVIEEINTNDLTQHNELGNLYSLYNQSTRGILLKSVNGLVTMTQELANAPAFSSYKKPTRIIANGIDLKNIIPFDAPNNKTPHLLFIATPGYYWHGVDKLVTLAENFPDLIIEVVGYDHIEGARHIPSNLILLGYLEMPKYQEAIARADAALGTIALHRKGMEEACPLKTRECLAYGVPMVLPYIDNDINNLDCDFLLKIPNKEDNMLTHGKIIRDFAYQMRGRRAKRELIANLDDEKKEAERLEFFREIAH